MKITLKVIPSSSKDRVEGWMGERLKVKVKAPPEKGKANQAVIRLLQKFLDLPKGSITLESGQTSSNKTIYISNDIENMVKEKLRKYYGVVTK